MKRSEFIDKVRELGYGIIKLDDATKITFNCKILVEIDEESAYRITNFISNSEELFDLCVEYAKTPLKEREEERKEEEKFYLQKIEEFYDVDYDGEFAYLNFDVEKNIFYLSNQSHGTELKTQFTQKEIDKIKEEQHTDLSEFKQIPVEEIEE